MRKENGAGSNKGNNSAHTPDNGSGDTVVAVIDVGSTAIRLVILELDASGGYQRLDRASRPVGLGRDVFITKTIKAASMMQAVQIMTGFAELLKSWNIEPEDAYVVATSAVREARNRDTFVDRIQTKTGFQVQIIDGVEENHLTYIAVLHAVENFRASFSRSNSIIMEVGGGSTELMIMYRGKMQAAQSLKVGTLRLEQQLKSRWDSGENMEEFLREQFRLHVANLHTDSDLKRIRYFIMVGGDARIASYNSGESVGEHYSIIKRDRFFDFVNAVQKKSVEETVRDLGVTYNEAEGLLPALLIFKIFLEETSAQEIIVPDVSIREGILLRNVMGQTAALDKNFASQVVASALSLGRRYHIDERHAQRVKELSLQLYDQLSEEHGLGLRERLYLEVASQLHDVGYFINQSGHHKHGQYIVAHSEIFGLSPEEIRIISNVVRYHRGAKPVKSHLEFGTLPRQHRLAVMKLAAILRVADALDRGHGQHFRNVKVEIDNTNMFISGEHSGDLSIERYGLNLKAGLFEEVYGYKVILR
ncbi:Ppx/GppA phosphatase family protein [Salinispira pacifica]|uniref:Exopolyphosphatase n=1 Tax=Salinispira pacifica TaxID=1307761 RepID=V5WME4_9SPIO|nr:Ppx/GppA phosphatase family protein [Salinispira pacifica]AHC16818.1 Exopolyphosphatase [Salinispira pacifica]